MDTPRELRTYTFEIIPTSALGRDRIDALELELQAYSENTAARRAYFSAMAYLANNFALDIEDFRVQTSEGVPVGMGGLERIPADD